MRLKGYLHVLILWTVLLSTSCAAPKKAVWDQHTEHHSVQEQRGSAERHLKDSTVIQAQHLLQAWLTARLQIVEARDETTERVTEIYDTTRPTDSATGTPPLLSRIRERHGATSRIENRTTVDLAKSDSTAATGTSTVTLAEAAEVRIESETAGEARTESREEKGSGKSLMWVSVALSLLAAAVIAIIVKHRSNNH